MKRARWILALVVSIGWLMADETLPQSPEALMTAYQKAIEAGDEAAILVLWELDLKNPKVVETRSEYARHLITEQKGGVFSLGPTPATDDFPLVMDGTKVEYLTEPKGMIVIKLATFDTSTMLPYARIGNGYKLVGQRWTKLDWSGPADNRFSFVVSSQSPANPEGPLSLKIRYNASGVILEKKLFLETASQSISGGFSAQHVTEIEVVENKGPPRLFKVKRSDDSMTVFADKIPTGAAGIIYSKKAADATAVTEQAK
jgi:hypothetical protein